jgi:ankyrin repeat protein
MHGHLELVRLLAERGADLTIPDRTYSSTPLGWAMHGEAPEVIRYFKTVPDRLDIWDAIELGATERAMQLLAEVDVNTAMRGASPGVLLRLAAGHGNRELVQAFLDSGADPTLETPYGMCASDVAREAGHDDIADLLSR